MFTNNRPNKASPQETHLVLKVKDYINVHQGPRTWIQPPLLPPSLLYNLQPSSGLVTVCWNIYDLEQIFRHTGNIILLSSTSALLNFKPLYFNHPRSLCIILLSQGTFDLGMGCLNLNLVLWFPNYSFGISENSDWSSNWICINTPFCY